MSTPTDVPSPAGSEVTRSRREVPALAKLAGFAVLLGAVFGVTLLVGGQVGPIGEPAAADHGGAHSDTTEAAEEGDMSQTSEGHDGHQSAPATEGSGTTDVPGGLQVSEAGYTFVLDEIELAAGERDVSFRIDGPDGQAVTDYEVEHEKELHLIAVRRDFTGFQHVHPVRATDGTWNTRVNLTGGTWRLFADFVPAPADGEEPTPLTLGADLMVTGPTGPSAGADPAESRVDVVDGYRVQLTGALKTGQESALRFAVTRNGEPLADLQPYLGARGHLVALREGDLAYLHVHPTDKANATGNEVGFAASVPSVGDYRLYLDFRVGGVVRTASFTLTAADSAVTGEQGASEDTGEHEEDDHTH